MSGKRLFAIFLIFVMAAVAWMVLAGSIQIRTEDTTGRLGEEVSGLWGTQQAQTAPTFTYSAAPKHAGVLKLEGSDLTAGLKLDQRRKGLLWYATYKVDFAAAYEVSNPSTQAATGRMLFQFPDPSGIYDGFAVTVDGRDVPVTYSDGAAQAEFPLKPHGSAVIKTGYRTNGMERWSYAPNPEGAGVIRDFHLTMNTDFAKVDYPEDGVSPTSKTRNGMGWSLKWDYKSVVSGREIALLMPAPMNPGPLVSRITLFAPVSLLFFFAALILLMVTSQVKLHPVHYGFLAAAFFAFDLMLAYLADQIDINVAFAFAAVTSVALVVGYLRIVVGRNRALVEIAISQLIFLVLFSYSFFFEGITGLAITIGAVLTLAFFMARTARVDWETVFTPKEPKSPQGQWVPLAQPATWVPQSPSATTSADEASEAAGKQD